MTIISCSPELRGPRSRPPNDDTNEEETVARLCRIVREKAAAAFKSWWEKEAPARYKELGIRLASGCPPELELARATLHRLLAARSGHGDFADYHERFEHGTPCSSAPAARERPQSTSYCAIKCERETCLGWSVAAETRFVP